MQILQSSFSSPMGGDPLEGEGIRFTCIVELAVGAGELKLASTDPQMQPHLNYGVRLRGKTFFARIRLTIIDGS